MMFSSHRLVAVLGLAVAVCSSAYGADPEVGSPTPAPVLGEPEAVRVNGALIWIHAVKDGLYLSRTQLRVKYKYFTSSGSTTVGEYLPPSNAHGISPPYYSGNTDVIITVRHTTLGTKSKTVQNMQSGTMDVTIDFTARPTAECAPIRPCPPCHPALPWFGCWR